MCQLVLSGKPGTCGDADHLTRRKASLFPYGAKTQVIVSSQAHITMKPIPMPSTAKCKHLFPKYPACKNEARMNLSSSLSPLLLSSPPFPASKLRFIFALFRGSCRKLGDSKRCCTIFFSCEQRRIEPQLTQPAQGSRRTARRGKRLEIAQEGLRAQCQHNPLILLPAVFENTLNTTCL